LEEENQKLKQRHNKIVLETFEGERYFRDESEGASTMDTGGITMTGDEIGQDELWCDELDGGKLLLTRFGRYWDIDALKKTRNCT
jgi:hypothetical protein